MSKTIFQERWVALLVTRGHRPDPASAREFARSEAFDDAVAHLFEATEAYRQIVLNPNAVILVFPMGENETSMGLQFRLQQAAGSRFPTPSLLKTLQPEHYRDLVRQYCFPGAPDVSASP